MVKETTTIMRDDLDGSKATETVRFGLDGLIYEIDLNATHARQIRKLLSEFIGGARRVRTAGVATPRGVRSGRAKSQSRSAKVQNLDIRNWAVSRGEPVGHLGRIPSAIKAKYIAAMDAEPAMGHEEESPAPTSPSIMMP